MKAAQLDADEEKLRPLLLQASRCTKLIKIYSVAYDFARAIQWLKTYDCDTTLADNIKLMANQNPALLVSCLEDLGTIPKLRHEVG
jgi:hypothetical protein